MIKELPVSRFRPAVIEKVQLECVDVNHLTVFDIRQIIERRTVDGIRDGPYASVAKDELADAGVIATEINVEALLG